MEWVSFPDGVRNPQLRRGAEPRPGCDREAPVAFLCRSGVRSVAAAEAATAAGFARAYNVADGLRGRRWTPPATGATLGGWKAAGLPWRQS